MILAYLDIGKTISEKTKIGWGTSVIKQLSKDFQHNFDKTLSSTEVANYTMQFKNEYDLSFLNLSDHHTEQELENAIVNNITKMLGQFRNDFSFIGKQFRLELDDKEYLA